MNFEGYGIYTTVLNEFVLANLITFPKLFFCFFFGGPGGSKSLVQIQKSTSRNEFG